MGKEPRVYDIGGILGKRENQQHKENKEWTNIKSNAGVE